MKRLCILFLVGAISGCALFEGKFYDERCTIPIPPFTAEITAACLEHDLDYRDKRVSRWEADRRLVVRLAPLTPFALSSWIVVRFAGLPWWGSDTIFDPHSPPQRRD